VFLQKTEERPVYPTCSPQVIDLDIYSYAVCRGTPMQLEKVKLLIGTLKTKKLLTFYSCLFVILVVWVILVALDAPYVPAVPGRLWPFLYVLLLVAIPVALLRMAMWRFFGNVAPNESIKMLLAAVSVAVVLYWVMQGYLAARLKVDLSGEAYKSTQEHYLVLASVRIANIGNSNTSVENASLTITPGDSQTPCAAGSIGVDGLSLGAGKQDKNPTVVRVGLDSPYYTIVWGTEETRQVVAECPAGNYYRLAFSLRVRQAFTNTAQTWRATAVVPVVQSAGRSPGWTEKDEKPIKLEDFIKSYLSGEVVHGEH
jgi:hypothetical protein